ncbi:MAG: hypothetical protein ACYDAO_04270 [Thermoplasmataceae archaeon]
MIKTNSLTFTIQKPTITHTSAGSLSIPGVSPIPMAFDPNYPALGSSSNTYIDHNAVLTIYSGQHAGTYTGSEYNDPYFTNGGYVWAVFIPEGFSMRSVNQVNL